MDLSGNAYAAWEQADVGCPDVWMNPITYSVWANRYEPGVGWGLPERIEILAGNSSQPRVEATPDGGAFVAWAQLDGDVGIWVSHYRIGVGWESPRALTANNGTNPSISVDSSGAAIVAWSEWNGSNYSLDASRFVPNTGWIPIDTLATGPLEFAPFAGAGPARASTVFWTKFELGMPASAVARRYVPGVGWGSVDDIDMGGDATASGLAVDPTGNATAVWFEGALWVRRFVLSGGWTPAARLSSRFVTSVDTAAGGDGSGVAAWDVIDGSRREVFASIYLPASGWSVETRLDSPNLSNAWKARAAMDARGNAIIVWQQSDGGLDSILANRYTANMGWGEAEFVETYSMGSADLPSVSSDPTGNAVAVWQQSDGTVTSILASRYTPPDSTPPVVMIVSPSDGFRTTQSIVSIVGTTEPAVGLVVNGIRVGVAANGTFAVDVPLRPGTNMIVAVATDLAGNEGRASLTVEFVDTLAEEQAVLRLQVIVGFAALSLVLAALEALRYLNSRRKKAGTESTLKDTGKNRLV